MNRDPAAMRRNKHTPHNGTNDPDNYYEPNQHVELRPKLTFCRECCVPTKVWHAKRTHREHEGTTKSRYRNPVEREQSHSETADRTKQAVDHDIIRNDPANPIEYAQSCP